MSFDESKATTLIRAILTEAGGRVGTFVPLARVLAGAGAGTTEVLRELAERRWVRVRDDKVAASKWALEFGMDWTNVPVLLRAIVNSAGGIGKSADMVVVVAASGLDRRTINELMFELEVLGLAAHLLIHDKDGRRHLGAYITSMGWEYLRTYDSPPVDLPEAEPPSATV